MGKEMGLDNHLRPFHGSGLFRHRWNHRRGDAYARLEVLPRLLDWQDDNLYYCSLPGIDRNSCVAVG